MEIRGVPLNQLMELMLPAVETELERSLSEIGTAELEGLHQMFAYHLGWEGEGAGPEARGKRIRPLLLLLTTSAAGGRWENALPAAAAVELIHNFSLIHDDIEDNSPTRRGRPTVWQKWGIAQAINAGDAMFTLAHLSILRMRKTLPANTVLQAASILQHTCLKLTEGQYLDISYEARGDLFLEAYWSMVSGKTAALLSACTELGALAAQTNPGRQDSFREFGHSLGLAFQAKDDLLGIWGDSALTGKSSESDLLARKKSLPVLYGLNQNGAFANRWKAERINEQEVASLAEQLKSEGGFEYTQEVVKRLTSQALQALERAAPEGDAGIALFALADKLLSRMS
jgi:geranylgeranyl diphosphate synthase, type I